LINNSLDNPTYTSTTITKEEILDNHMSVLCSFGISTKDGDLDLPSLCWIVYVGLSSELFIKQSM
jgi:hypothetical protein